MRVGILTSGLTALVSVRLSAMFYILTDMVTVSLKPPLVVANVTAVAPGQPSLTVWVEKNVVNYTTVKQISSGIVTWTIVNGLDATCLFRSVNTIMTANSSLQRVIGETWGRNALAH